VSNRTKEEQRMRSLPPGMLPKAERRKLGKEAAAKRRRAARNRKIYNGLAAGFAGVAVLAVILALFGVFGGGDPANPTASGSADPSASASAGANFTLPEGMDQALATKPVVTAGTGDVTKLKVTTLVEGKGAAVTSGQTITVNYVGVTYKDGEQFDASWGKQPYTTAIGVGSVIKGWDQGLVGVKVGSRVQLDIPADLAYGENGQVPGDLRFVVDVLEATAAQ